MPSKKPTWDKIAGILGHNASDVDLKKYYAAYGVPEGDIWTLCQRLVQELEYKPGKGGRSYAVPADVFASIVSELRDKPGFGRSKGKRGKDTTRGWARTLHQALAEQRRHIGEDALINAIERARPIADQERARELLEIFARRGIVIEPVD